jgi:hypothetical protein
MLLQEKTTNKNVRQGLGQGRIQGVGGPRPPAGYCGPPGMHSLGRGAGVGPVAGKKSSGRRYGGPTEGLYWCTVGEEVKTEEEEVKKKCERRKFDSGV